MDNDLKSTFALRRQINSKENCPIAFSDLWHLYEHGQEVRTPGDQIQVFRVAKFTGGRDLLCESPPQDVPLSCIERQDSKGIFFVECYSYDFNGTQYGPVQTMFEIRRYEGLRDITSLQVYPLWFDPDHQNKRVQMLRRGDKFIALTRANRTAHKSYHGLTLDEHAEEIESPIVVDFQLAITKGRMRAPLISFQSKLDCDPQDPEELGEDERLLLPYSLHGFVLRSKKWRTFNIDKVEDIKFSSGFDDLVLPRGHKDTVEALVNRHSRYNKVGSTESELKTSMDLVTGKGRGLIILLHGAPGVGKTSTAECVAERTERPLFAITCGDLGESAIEVEESLEKNFSLAHRWGCLLLLDEADVFLSLRSQTDLRRNAVVSVFLRTLEYYSGILFLTTNRVGTLDPAFKSRIHLSLYYPNLTRKASSKIWRNHIQKANDYFEKKGTKYSLRRRDIIDFSKRHFKDLSGQESGPWNGRQIRNAFQTAIALSEHEAHLNGGNPELGERHFREVAKASSEFDKYLRLTHGRSESQMAEATKIRTDNPGKAEKMKAAIASRQLPRGQPNPEDESSDSDSDSSEPYSSDASETSSYEETPPAKASKKTGKK
ncbi:P-loop containing nucleoside triphosphate hydrolase protein, partial [Usnea florida]